MILLEALGFSGLLVMGIGIVFRIICKESRTSYHRNGPSEREYPIFEGSEPVARALLKEIENDKTRYHELFYGHADTYLINRGRATGEFRHYALEKDEKTLEERGLPTIQERVEKEAKKRGLVKHRCGIDKFGNDVYILNTQEENNYYAKLSDGTDEPGVEVW